MSYKIEEIEGGIQIFAQAWNLDGTQVGFGKDGTVDIERFQIINPPILVPDENGDVYVKVFDAMPPTTIENLSFNINDPNHREW